jgi:hypothetical protein
MFDDLFKKYVGSTDREPGYAYGSILPYRVKTDAQGNPVPGTGDWGLAYSDAAKGMFDTLMTPRQAMQGQSFTPEQAMNFAMNVTAPGVATARYSPGMFNMPMVYHGTFHRFEPTPDNPLGEFRASQIGTGEGAQAYGHGIYVAESPRVATDYRNRLSYNSIAQEFLNKLPEDASTDEVLEVVDSLSPVQGNLIKALAEEDWLGFDYPSQAISAALTSSKFEAYYPDVSPKLKNAIKEAKGFLYTADLPDEMVDRMLDWDKPLSEQSESIRGKLRQLNPLTTDKYGNVWGGSSMLSTNNDAEDIWMKMSVKGAYQKLSGIQPFVQLSARERRKLEAEASKKLSGMGIPGVKYLDAGSRGDKANPTRNFVLFPGEEKKAKIIKRE